ncbi:MAG: YDG domain-containing protein, partial [Treponema sp.]|nr:YDG domain-containing protein [Treponema sp.]
MKFRHLFILFSAVLLALFAACDDGGGGGGTPGISNINSVDIQIAVPRNSAAPYSIAIAKGPNAANITLGTVTWSEFENTSWNQNTFASGKEYIAEITLTANTNYKFTNGSNVTINGSVVDSFDLIDDGNKIEISRKFETDARILSEITIKASPTKMSYTHGDSLDLAGMVVTLSYTSSEFADEDVPYAQFGSHSIEVRLRGALYNDITSLVSNNHNNYPLVVSERGTSVTPKNTANLTVNQRALTITGATTSSKPYDGSPTATGVTVPSDKINNIFGSDTVTINTITAIYTNPNVVTGQQYITISGATPSNNNYTINLPVTVPISSGGIIKAAGAAVSTPTLNTRTPNSITITAVTPPSTGQTVEYARNTVNTAPATGWQ